MLAAKRYFLFLVAVLNWSACQPAKAPPIPLKPLAERQQIFSRPANSATPQESRFLEDFLDGALQNNPTLKAAATHYEESSMQGRQAGSLENPLFSYSYFVDPVETRAGPMRHRLSLKQKLPWFQKLSIRKKIAASDTEVMLMQLEQKRDEILLRVIEKVLMLWSLSESYKITQANLALIKQWEEVITQNYRTQDKSQDEIVKAQMELAQLGDRLKELEQLRSPVRREILRLTGIKVKGVPSADSEIFRRLLTEAQKLTRYTEYDFSNHPRLRIAQKQTQIQESKSSLANLEIIPDITLGIDYTSIGDIENSNVSGQDSIAPTVAFSIPLNLGNFKAKQARARLGVGKSRHLTNEVLTQLAADADQAKFDFKDSQRRITLYRKTLLPKAEEALNASYKAFGSGQQSFTELLNAERTLLSFKLILSKAEANLRMASARLVTLLGKQDSTS